MWRFPLPAFLAAIVTLSLPSVRALGDDAAPSQPPPSSPPVPAQSPPDSDVAKHHEEPNNTEQRAADLRRQVSGLQSLVAQVKQQLVQRKAQKSPVADAGGQPAAHDAQEQQAADLQRQDRELHSQLQGLIVQLGEELQLEMRSPPALNTAEQQERQTARDAFKHAIADLQQQDNQRQELIAGDQQALVQSEMQRPAAVPNVGQQRQARDTLERQAADMRNQIADLQRQDDALQRQLAENQKELAQSAQDLAQRRHDLDAARAEADDLRQVIDTLRQQHQAKEGSLTQQKAQGQQTAAAVSARPASPKTDRRPTQPMVARQPPIPRPLPPLPAPQPMQALPSPSAAQQLQAARQWLSVGRPDEARRVLAMVQTQMVFQPVTPGHPAASSSNPSATNVGDAIRSLDIGATGQAMQSITRAINNTNAGGGGHVRAWSGYPAGTP
jgi:hypothetical protein